MQQRPVFCRVFRCRLFFFSSFQAFCCCCIFCFPTKTTTITNTWSRKEAKSQIVRETVRHTQNSFRRFGSYWTCPGPGEIREHRIPSIRLLHWALTSKTAYDEWHTFVYSEMRFMPIQRILTLDNTHWAHKMRSHEQCNGQTGIHRRTHSHTLSHTLTLIKSTGHKYMRTQRPRPYNRSRDVFCLFLLSYSVSLGHCSPLAK